MDWWRRLVCRVFTHDIQQTVWYRVGNVYPRTLGWCHRCERWLEVAA